MENKSKSVSLRIILITMTIGICAIVLQNAGIIPTKQNVYVKGGYVNVSGSVDVDNTVYVSGSVDVDNTVSVSNDEVLGKDNKKYYYNNR